MTTTPEAWPCRWSVDSAARQWGEGVQGGSMPPPPQALGRRMPSVHCRAYGYTAEGRTKKKRTKEVLLTTMCSFCFDHLLRFTCLRWKIRSRASSWLTCKRGLKTLMSHCTTRYEICRVIAVNILIALFIRCLLTQEGERLISSVHTINKSTYLCYRCSCCLTKQCRVW